MSARLHSTWTLQEALPTAWVESTGGNPYAHHVLAGWRMKAEIYLDGSVRPLSVEFGSRYFVPAPFHPGHQKARLILAGGEVELDLQRLPGVRWALTPGAAQAVVPLSGGFLHFEVFIADLEARDLLFGWSWHGSDPKATAPKLILPTNLAGAKPGNHCLAADVPHYGRIGWAANGNSLEVHGNAWQASLAEPLLVRVGYDPAGVLPKPPSAGEYADLRATGRQMWQKMLGQVQVRSGCDPVEIRWSTQLLVGSSFYDNRRGYHCTGNGHLYLLNHQWEVLDQPGSMVSFRDGNQVAWALAGIAPTLARDQVLRSAAASCPRRGIPQMSNATPGHDVLWKAPGGEHGAATEGLSIASEQVWWWILALAEVLDHDGAELLRTELAASDGWTAPLSGHLDRLLGFAWNKVGVGAHGIPRMLSGDWNDWLGALGPQGRGESFMNAGLAIVAQDRLAAALRRTGDVARASLLEKRAAALRQICAPFGNGPWWPRAIADDGRLVGDVTENRVYLDGQPWMALAQIGEPAKRQAMLRTALSRCDTPIGPAIIDRPLDRDDFPGRTHCLYPPGAGENGGVWWIVGHWMALALEAAGCQDEAIALHHRCARTNHHRHFPGEWWSPFMAPDGLDGPASPHFGRAQQAAEAYPQPWTQGFPRAVNPDEVAKWAYQLAFATGRKLV